MSCLNLSNKNIAKIAKEFGEVKTSKLLDKYFPNTIPSFEEFIANKNVKDELGIIPISKVKDEIGVSFKKEISNQQLINLKKAISKTNDKIKDFVYLLFNVKQIGQADLYTWGLRKVKGNLNIQAKLDRAVQQSTNTVQSNSKINNLQDRVNKDRIQGTLFGLNTQNQEKLEFHINTLNVIGQFLENVGVEQRLVPEFLSQEGNVVEGAIAAANFIQGTVDIIDDVEKRPSAWNKLPEEAAHWWYRLLDKNSELKDALLTSALTDRKEEELRNSLYGKTYNGVKVVGKLALDSNGNVTSKPALSAIREEAIGQLIAEAIKRIETQNGSAADYSFFKKFLEWINSIIDIFKNTKQDPFEVAAMKILSSDMSDLMTWEEYRKLNNIVNFADVLTEQSVAPIDYTLIEDLGKVEKINEVVGFTNDGKRISQEKFLWVGKDQQVNGGLQFGKTSPSFLTMEELARWVSANIKQYDTRQKQILQEVRDNQVFFDRLLNKTFRKKSKFLPKTLRKYFDIIDAQNLNPLREWNISQELQQITKKLSEQEKKQIIETNGYTNIAPTLKVLPDLLQKYGRKTTPEIIKQEIEITNKLVKKEITKEQATELRQKLENKKKGNPIVLSEPIKIDGAKKQELSILNGIREMIKLENSNLKSITAEEFVAEAHNWLETNYLLGFANENSYLSYRTDQTFTYLKDRISNEDFQLGNMTEEEIQRLPFEERQRIANIVGLTKQNPDVYHNKVSLRFNDMYHLKSGHFDKSPSAWGNLTYFYTGKSKWKDAVLLHEIQNDNIEALREFKVEKVDLETSLGRYLQQLNTDLIDNITQIESGNKRIQKNDIFSTNPPRQHFQLNHQLQQLYNLPLEQGLNQLKQRLNEKIELYKSDNSVTNNPEKAQEEVEKAYSQRRKFADFQRKGGIKSLLSEQELQNLKDVLNELNTGTVMTDAVYMPDENQYEPGYETIRNLKQKKQDFKLRAKSLEQKINSELTKLYGTGFPVITLEAPVKPLPKSQRRNQIVGHGENRRVIGNASQELNENVNFLIAFSEQKINKQLSKNIEESKKIYIQARNATNAYNFNVRLAKITQEQYNNLIENYKYNQDLLNRLIDEQAQKDIQKESDLESKIKEELDKIKQNYLGFWGIPNEYNDNGILQQFNTKEEAETAIKNKYDINYNKNKQQQKFEALKQKALDKKAELEKNYGKIEEEVKQTLEIEMNYFTPLVHYLIQKHINQYGKEFPMYFSGYQITKLTQGNERTAWIYAGKDEIDIVDKRAFKLNNNQFVALEKKYYKDKVEISQQEYEKAYQQATERRAKEIKFEAAKQIGFLSNEHNGTNLSDLTDKELDEGIKELNQYKRQSRQNMDRVINTIMNISNNKPIETGAIYNAMSQISGIKLIWQDKIDGLQGNPGGYLVDLTNYNYNVPILYGLESKKQNNQKSPTSETNNNNLQEGLQWLKQIMPDVNPMLVDGLIDNIANGSYDILNDLITLSKDFANKNVVKEEAFHRLFSMLPKEEQEKLLNEGSKKYGIRRGKSTATIKYSQADQNKVNYVLKAVDILQSNKAKQVFEKGRKANWDLNKILTELQIPKEQKQLILDLGKTNIDEIITDLLANYSYTVEINTAKEANTYNNKVDEYGNDERDEFDDFENAFVFNGYEYEKNTKHIPFGYAKRVVIDINDDNIDYYEEVKKRKWETISPFEYNEARELVEKEDSRPTQYHSNLTVPGGTNYTEQEIATPAITPSIKGHAQFSTDNGIGWFRSDDKAPQIKGWQKDEVDWMDSESAIYNAITPNDKIIWGHPTIGKSFLKEKGDNSFITLDDDYADEVNAFIDKNRGNQTRQEYKGSKPKEYNKFMLDLFDRLKTQAKKEGKRLFVSNTNILKERMSEFDKVITIPKDEFKKRFDKRGSTYGFEDWKSDIDKTVNKVDSNKVIETTKYLSDLLEPQVKTRRILELQSDLFQKGRDLDDLVTKQTKSSLDTFSTNMSNLNRALDEGRISLEEYRKERNILEDNQKIGEKFRNLPDNQFLQILNKDNNWVTFFLKSILQDSAKKGYEKVLFPTGKTVSKIEQFDKIIEKIEEFNTKIKTLENSTINDYVKTGELSGGVEVYRRKDNQSLGHTTLQVSKDFTFEDNIKESIDKLKKDKSHYENTEKQRLGTINFYENTVANILKKQGYNPKLITDEYGNTWNEITITPKMSETIRLNTPKGKIEYTGDLAIEEKIAEEAYNSKDEKIPATLIGKFIQSIRNLFRNLFKERDNISRLIRNLNQGRFNLQNNQNGQGVRYSINQTIKPGVAELFESNPELANAVYEVMKFDNIDNLLNIISNKYNIVQSKLSDIDYNKLAGSGNAQYRPLENFIFLKKSLKDDSFILHELVHAIIHNNLNVKRKGELEKTNLGINLKDIKDKSFEIFKKQKQNYPKEIVQYIENIFEAIKKTGIEEFLTYGLSNPIFNKFLNNSKSSVAEELLLFERDATIWENINPTYNKTSLLGELHFRLSQTMPIPKLETITPQQKQQALQLYSQYLDTIFPDSKVKDIVYHATDAVFERFKPIKPKFDTLNSIEGVYNFTTNKEFSKRYGKNILSVILNINNPIQEKTSGEFIDDMDRPLSEGLYKIGKKKSDNILAPKYNEALKNTDAIINRIEGDNYAIPVQTVISVFEPEQIHILSSKQDIEGFKEFVNNNQNTNEDTSRIFYQLAPDTTRTKLNNELELFISNLLNRMGVKKMTFKKYLEEYSKANPDKKINMVAFADMMNKIIAFSEARDGTTMPEEAWHFLIEMFWDEPFIKELRNLVDENGIPEFKNTELWKTQSELYKGVYSETIKDPNKLEEKVEKEIIAKLLAQNIYDQFKEEGSLSHRVINVLKKLLNYIAKKLGLKIRLAKITQTEVNTKVNEILNKLNLGLRYGEFNNLISNKFAEPGKEIDINNEEVPAQYKIPGIKDIFSHAAAIKSINFLKARIQQLTNTKTGLYNELLHKQWKEYEQIIKNNISDFEFTNIRDLLEEVNKFKIRNTNSLDVERMKLIDDAVEKLKILSRKKDIDKAKQDQLLKLNLRLGLLRKEYSEKRFSAAIFTFFFGTDGTIDISSEQDEEKVELSSEGAIADLNRTLTFINNVQNNGHELTPERFQMVVDAYAFYEPVINGLHGIFKSGYNFPELTDDQNKKLKETMDLLSKVHIKDINDFLIEKSTSSVKAELKRYAEETGTMNDLLAQRLESDTVNLGNISSIRHYFFAASNSNEDWLSIFNRKIVDTLNKIIRRSNDDYVNLVKSLENELKSMSDFDMRSIMEKDENGKVNGYFLNKYNVEKFNKALEEHGIKLIKSLNKELQDNGIKSQIPEDRETRHSWFRGEFLQMYDSNKWNAYLTLIKDNKGVIPQEIKSEYEILLTEKRQYEKNKKLINNIKIKYDREWAKWFNANTMVNPEKDIIIALRKSTMSESEFNMWYNSVVKRVYDFNGELLSEYYRGELSVPSDGTIKGDIFEDPITGNNVNIQTIDYRNEEYDKLNPDVKKVLNKFLEFKKRADLRLGISFTYEMSMRLPQIPRSTSDLVANRFKGLKGALKEGIAGVFKERSHTPLFGEELNGNVLQKPRIRFIKKIDNIENISQDLLRTLVQYNEMSINYEEFIDAKPELDGMIHIAKYNKNKQKRDKVFPGPENIRENILTAFNSKFKNIFKKEEGDSDDYLVRKMENLLSSHVYGIKYTDNSNFAKRIGPFMNWFSQYVRNLRLGGNVTSIIKGLVSAVVDTIGQSLIKRYTTLEDYTYGMTEYLREQPRMNWELNSLLKTTKIESVANYMDLVGSLSRTSGNHTRNRAIKVISNSIDYGLWGYSDKMLKYPMMVAIGNNLRYYNGKLYSSQNWPGTKEEYSKANTFWSLINSENGKVTFDKTVSESDINYFTNYVKTVSSRLDGQILSTDKGAIYNHPILQLATITTGFLFQQIDLGIKGEHYNYLTNQREIGYLNNLKNFDKIIGFGWNTMNNAEKNAARQLYMFMITAAVLNVLAFTLQAAGADDKPEDSPFRKFLTYTVAGAAIEHLSRYSADDITRYAQTPFSSIDEYNRIVDALTMIPGLFIDGTDDIGKGSLYTGYDRSTKALIRAIPHVRGWYETLWGGYINEYTGLGAQTIGASYHYKNQFIRNNIYNKSYGIGITWPSRVIGNTLGDIVSNSMGYEYEIDGFTQMPTKKNKNKTKKTMKTR